MQVKGFPAALYNRLHRTEIYTRAEYWDAKASQFSGDAVSMWPNNNLNRLYHEEQLRFLEPHLKEFAGRRVLDLGCGTGRLSRLLASHGAHVVGIDFSAKAIDIARGLTPGNNPEYRVQSVFDLEYEAFFDFALTWSCITVACRNADELLAVMQRLHRSLRPGGKVFVVEPIHTGFLRRVLNLNQPQFMAVMTAVGLCPREIKHLHFWPARILLAYVSWPRVVTSVTYHVGQWVMKSVFRDHAFGDYTAIEAQALQT